MRIRQENINDHNKVYNLIKKAFDSAEESDGNEQDLVVGLRKSNSFIPELSLVATMDDKTVGHILFTKVYVGRSIQLALAPLSVHPKYQRRGIGLALIKEGHKIAKKLGYDYSIVLGNPNYYSKAGYVSADTYGIKAPFDVPKENFMAFKLNDKAENVNCIVKYDNAFKIN